MARYETGYDFYRDLASNYGREQAALIAGDYVLMQTGTADPEEWKFCLELISAVNSVDARKGA
jgi:hypothetical protein